MQPSQLREGFILLRFDRLGLLPDILEAISAACPRTRERHPGRRCQAYLPDLTEPRPPDLPRHSAIMTVRQNQQGCKPGAAGIHTAYFF